MSSTYCKLVLFGSKVSEEEYANIPNPRLELHLNTMSKTIQAMTVAGLFASIPLTFILKSHTNPNFVKEVGRISKIALYGGIVSGPVVTEAQLMTNGSSKEEVYKQAYQMRKNFHQLRKDRGVTYGMLLGAASTGFTHFNVIAAVGVGAGIGTLVGKTYDFGAFVKPQWMQLAEP